MQEALSYMAGAQLPVVVVNIMRGGPGLGGILPSQADYFQAVKGGGHGDYRVIVLAPASVQEAVDLTILAFDLADKYRNPVMIIGDGMIGQMMESVEFPEKYREQNDPEEFEWALTGSKGREPLITKSLYLDPTLLEKNCLVLADKYKIVREQEVRYELYNVSNDNKIMIAAYGTMARICQTVIDELKEEGISAGLFRPISLFPFPDKEVYDVCIKDNIKAVLTVEMSIGQMVEDIERCLMGKKPIDFFGRTGGIVPSPIEVKDKIREMLKE
jgi:2-oxoglutarate ferredoxin oxidoreductase subunit alpha